MENCAISGNKAPNRGGGIFNNGKLTGNGCAFLGNFAVDGGAIYGSSNLSNCTTSGNEVWGEPSPGKGGAILATGTSTFNSCTFAERTVNTTDTASIYNQGSITAGNTIFVSTPFNKGTFVDGGYNLTSDYGAGLFTAPTSRMNTFVYFEPLALNGGSTPTLPLREDSPAIDSGNTALSTDQRGMPRPYGAAADIGAYERQAVNPPLISVYIAPDHPRPDDTLTASVDIIENTGGPLTYTWKWERTRNGVTVTLPEKSNKLSTKGDIVIADDDITVTVVGNNGTYSSTPSSYTRAVRRIPIYINSLTLTPKNPYTFEKIVATVKTNAGSSPVFYTYEWICVSPRNNSQRVVRTVTRTRKNQDVYDLSQKNYGAKDEYITVTVSVTDDDTSYYRSSIAYIRNSVPVLTGLALTPQAPAPGQVVTSSFTGTDADGDALTKIYKWKVGTKVLAEEKSGHLDLAKYPNIKAGDVITLEMRLSDGESLSKTMSASVTVGAAPAGVVAPSAAAS